VGKMMTNLIITALGVGSVLFLMKSDVRHGSAMLRRNVKTIRAWLEDEGASAAARSGYVAALPFLRGGSHTGDTCTPQADSDPH
jgi:hypothetical protein